MKVKCPYCQAVAQIDTAKIPDQGAQARCPKCKERIFVERGRIEARKSKPPSPAAPPQVEQTPPPPSDPPLRPTSVRPSARPPDPKKDLQWEDDLNLVTVETRIGSGVEWVIIGLSFIILAGMVLYVGMSSGPQPVAMEAEAQPTIDQTTRGMGKAYAGPEIRSVIATMRRKIAKDSYMPYKVSDPQGPEFVVLNEIIGHCPATCTEILSAGLIPLETEDGFSAKVRCRPEGELTLTYRWTTNDAAIDGAACP